MTQGLDHAAGIIAIHPDDAVAGGKLASRAGETFASGEILRAADSTRPTHKDLSAVACPCFLQLVSYELPLRHAAFGRRAFQPSRKVLTEANCDGLMHLPKE